MGPGSYISGSNGKKLAPVSIDSTPDSSPPNSTEGTDQSFNLEIIPDSPSIVPEAPFSRTNGFFASAGSFVPNVASADGYYTTEQLQHHRAPDTFSQIGPLLSKSLRFRPCPAVPEFANSDFSIRSEASLNQTGTSNLTNRAGCTSLDRSLGPGSWTLRQPGSHSEIHQKLILSMPVNSKMAGALFLPVEPTSAGINSLKNDSRLFFDIKLRSLDMPQQMIISVKFLIDSGAEISALSYQDFLNSVKPLSKLYPSKIHLHNFDNSHLRKPKGQINLKISVGREWVTANFQVVSNSCQSMLGAPEL